jgi:Cu-Zn family superoxide dismutase
LSLELLAPHVTLSQGDRSVLDRDGSALVLHERADDYLTDPAGNAGDRIACGVITAGQ